MGPNNPDPDGNVKCHDDECGKERQGPWICDEDGCIGELTHAGAVVEAMHVFFWSFAVLWALVSIGFARKRMKEHTSPSSLNIMAKALAFLKVFTVVAIIHLIVYAICVVGRPNLLYRAPPIESLEPRFYETAKPEDRFKSYKHTGDYLGAYSETLMSYTNTFIMNHMMFYMLLMGTCSIVIITEWLGHHFYLGHQDGEILGSEIPQLGHAAFVLAVSVALLTPPSVMTVLVFIVGLTKVGYPEMLINCWLAFGVEAQPPESLTEYFGKKPETTLQSLVLQTALREKFHSHHDSCSDNEAATAAAVIIQTAWRKSRARRVTIRKRVASVYSGNEDLDIEGSKNLRITFYVCQFLAAVGLMLHHFTMVVVFLAGFLAAGTYTSTDQGTYTAGLRGVLFLVLLQHVVSQLAPNGIIRTAFLLPIEVVFQWYSFANIGETGSNLLSCSIFNLAMSHWFMTPIIVVRMLGPCCREDKKKNDSASPHHHQSERQEHHHQSKGQDLQEVDQLLDPAIMLELPTQSETGGSAAAVLGLLGRPSQAGSAERPTTDPPMLPPAMLPPAMLPSGLGGPAGRVMDNTPIC